MRAKPSIAFASVLIGTVAALSAPADAACKKFGFTVNDYGKDGPTNDAKNLLDKHISEWAVQNKVTDYTTGKKTVSCELFLDVILFDEHTCTASATVCWGPDAKKLGAQSAAVTTDESGAAAPPAPVRKAHALGQATTQAAAEAPATAAPADAAVPPAETAAPADSAAAEAAPTEAAPTTPVEQIAAPAETPPAPPAVQSAPAVQATTPPTTVPVVETGALQAGQMLPMASQKHAAPGASDKDRAAAAAAAASAAAAAERAAQAAETAANAAKEAAAAAVAASAASRKTATVPPLDHASRAKSAHTE